MTAMQYLVLTAGAALCVPWLVKRLKKGFLAMFTSILWLILILLDGWIILLYAFQPRMLYFPQKNILFKPSDVGLAYETVELTTSDNIKLDAWFIPCPDARFTILFCHGNAGNIGNRIDSLEIFHRLGLNCLIFDYRGYGNSAGRPSELGTYLDARAAWLWLTDYKKIPPENIILFGRSLGGAVAGKLASQTAPAGLALESCFTSFVDIAKHYYPFLPVKTFARFDYNTLESVKKINCPLLVIHSTEDEIIPFTMGEKLYQAALTQKKFARIEGSHNEGFIESGQDYINLWRTWLNNLQVPSKSY